MRSRSSARPATALRLAAASLLLAGGALLAVKPAHAALATLDDVELSQVNGRAAPPWSAQQRHAQTDALPLFGGLLSLFTPEQLKLNLLDRAGFEAALAARGMNALPDALYDGRPVLQLAIDAPPVNLQMEAGRFLLQNFGLTYLGPSFGTINITSLDARGTTLWIWKH
jgi:hypothetical protein